LKSVFVLLGFSCLLWAAWSLTRWLFLPASDLEIQPGWKWLVSIVLELVLASVFFAMANEKRR